MVVSAPSQACFTRGEGERGTTLLEVQQALFLRDAANDVGRFFLERSVTLFSTHCRVFKVRFGRRLSENKATFSDKTDV